MPFAIEATAALPDRSLWPDRPCSLPELQYADVLDLSVELIDRRLPRLAHKVAIRAADACLTYEELGAEVARAGHALRQAGVAEGDRVLLRLPAGARMVAVWLAAQRLGAIAVGTLPALKARELASIVDDAEPSVCVVDADLADPLIAACAQAIRPPRILNSGGRADDPTADSLDALMAGAPAELAPAPRPRDAIAAIIYTADADSAAPKGACHSAADLLAAADTYAAHLLSIGPDDVCGGPLSPALAYGLGALIVFPLRAGATAALTTAPDVETMAHSLGRDGLTLFFATATSYRLLLRLPDAPRHLRGTSLRLAISSGEPLERGTAEAWRAATGVPLIDGFGTSEMAHIFLSQRTNESADGTLGRAVPGYEVRVVDSAFRNCPAGVEGRLIVRGPTGCRYWRRPAAQRRAVDRGWNVTGDVCVRLDDGRIRFVGRTGGLFVSAGYNISAREVATVLREHSAVAEALVAAAPDAVRGAVPKAWIVLRPGTVREGLEAALARFTRERLAGYKCPRLIEIVERLPPG